MKPSTIGNIKFGDAKYTVEYDESKKDISGNVLAKEFTFKFENTLPLGKDYVVTVSDVESYADVKVENYSQTHKTPYSEMAKELFLTGTSVDGDTVNVEYFNNADNVSKSDSGLSFNIICAVYDESGAMADLQILPVENVKKGESIKKAFTFIGSWADYKVFTWSSFADINPILNAYDSRIAQ